MYRCNDMQQRTYQWAPRGSQASLFRQLEPRQLFNYIMCYLINWKIPVGASRLTVFAHSPEKRNLRHLQAALLSDFLDSDLLWSVPTICRKKINSTYLFLTSWLAGLSYPPIILCRVCQTRCLVYTILPHRDATETPKIDSEISQRTNLSVSPRFVCSLSGRVIYPRARGLHGMQPTPKCLSEGIISRSSSRYTRL